MLFSFKTTNKHILRDCDSNNFCKNMRANRYGQQIQVLYTLHLQEVFSHGNTTKLQVQFFADGVS